MGPFYKPVDGVISLDIRPERILVRDGRIYISSWHDRQILVLDEATGQQLHQFESFDKYTATINQIDEDGKVGGERREIRRSRPGSMALVGDKLFVLQTFAKAILVLHAPSMRPKARINVHRSNGRLAVAPNGKRIYFASNKERAFYIIDTMSYASRRVPYPKEGHGISALAVAPNGRRLYLGIQRGAREAGADPPAKAAGPANPLERTYSGPLLAVYDLTARRYVALKSIGDTLGAQDDDSSVAAAMEFSRDGRKLYIAMAQSTAGVHVYDTETDNLLSPIAFANRHRDLAVRDGKLYVAIGSNNKLAIVDEDMHHVIIKTIEFDEAGRPGKMAMHDDKLYVCHSDSRRITVVPIEEDDSGPRK